MRNQEPNHTSGQGMLGTVPFIKAISLWLKSKSAQWWPRPLRSLFFLKRTWLRCGLLSTPRLFWVTGRRQLCPPKLSPHPPWTVDGDSHAEVALGRTSRIFGLEYFPFHSEKEGREGGQKEEGREDSLHLRFWRSWKGFSPHINLCLVSWGQTWKL